MLKITSQQMNAMARADAPAGKTEAPQPSAASKLIAPCPEPPPRKRICSFSG